MAQEKKKGYVIEGIDGKSLFTNYTLKLPISELNISTCHSNNCGIKIRKQEYSVFSTVFYPGPVSLIEKKPHGIPTVKTMHHKEECASCYNNTERLA